jgi:hypothetical protein
MNLPESKRKAKSELNRNMLLCFPKTLMNTLCVEFQIMDAKRIWMTWNLWLIWVNTVLLYCALVYTLCTYSMVDLVSLLHHKQNVRASSVCLSFGHQRYFPYDGMVGRIPYNPKDVSVYVLCRVN